VQELAFALATAVGVLDAVRDSGQVAPDDFPEVVGRISFFVNAGIRFVEEMCKMRAFTTMWERLCATRYGVTDPKLRRFRYGMQVNSLGLTEAQPENNVQRIILEMLGVTLSRDARARAVQLPTWNEALGLPRPWDQQWSLRYQQVLAYETDLLEYEDIFNGSTVIAAKTEELIEAATAELDSILDLGGVWEAIEEMKSRLVTSQAERSRRIESGEQVVVGVNRFTEGEPNPLGGDEAILRVDPRVEHEMAEDVVAWRTSQRGVAGALSELQAAARSGANVMPATIALAAAGGTTGQWGAAMREVFGEYRAPTGVAAAVGHRGTLMRDVAARVKAIEGGPPRLLVAKPGLDGHSNGAEQIAVAARDAGFEVVYQGIRSTIPEIAASARDEDVDLIGISILSGSHLELLPELLQTLRDVGVDAPVVVGGIIPEEDRPRLEALGVAAVYTPKDFELARIMGELADLVDQRRRGLSPVAPQRYPQAVDT
jgi:(2R)-ethylmalonyl-CoA mutase